VRKIAGRQAKKPIKYGIVAAPQEIMTPASSATLPWPVSLLAHYFVAVAGSLIVGFLPEAFVSPMYYNTGLEPYSPMIAATAIVLGYFAANRILDGRAATFVWIIGLAWIVFGIYDETKYWSATWSPEKTHWAYALANFFGPTVKCSGSECLAELLYTTPFTASVTYSVGAYLRKWRTRRSVDE